jgi:hypothetical protein
MKTALYMVFLVLFIFSFSSYNTCWALHDDDTITRGGAWDTDDVIIERPESSTSDKNDKGTFFEIVPEDTDKEKEPAQEDNDEEGKAEE